MYGAFLRFHSLVQVHWNLAACVIYVLANGRISKRGEGVEGHWIWTTLHHGALRCIAGWRAWCLFSCEEKTGWFFYSFWENFGNSGSIYSLDLLSWIFGLLHVSYYLG